MNIQNNMPPAMVQEMVQISTLKSSMDLAENHMAKLLQAIPEPGVGQNIDLTV